MPLYIKVNPVEYGHIFLVPYDINRNPKLLDKKMLYLFSQCTKEISNSSFRIFFDMKASAHSDRVYFQVKP